MRKIIGFILISLVLFSCSTQKKTIMLANGKMISQKQYDRGLQKAFRKAKRAADKSMRGKLSRKQRKELFNNTTIKVETTD